MKWCALAKQREAKRPTRKAPRHLCAFVAAMLKSNPVRVTCSSDRAL
jgi:hypothetical protein